MPKQELTAEIIAAAIGGYEFQKTRIDARIAELRAMLSGPATEAAAAPQPPQRWKQSPICAKNCSRSSPRYAGR